MKTSVNPAKGLRTTLITNSVFSGLSGLTMTIGAKPLALFMGIAHELQLLIVGVNLIAFALFLFWLAKRPIVPPNLVWSVVLGDLLWVVFSGIGLVTVPHQLSVAGESLVTLVAAIVTCFAGAQIHFLVRSSAQFREAR